jgi:glyoxylase-like metal-dependent hydrolase (beta-lactamase superfamily II)
MSTRIDVILIGQLSRNSLWSEKNVVRPPIATTSLIRGEQYTILVDPTLDGEPMARCLLDRTGLRPDQIDIVFLTSFHPTHRRGLGVFESASWLIGDAERTAVITHLERLREGADASAAPIIDRELAVLERIESADDTLDQNVHLFPSPGATPGCTGLLIADLQTTIVAGDAVLTRDHFEKGQVWQQSADPELAKTSLAEVNEIADLIIPGHDNIFASSVRFM